MISLKEQIAYITVRFLSFIFISLPLRISLFLGKTMGALAYYLDIKHKNLAYTHIKLALSKEFNPKEIKKIVKRLFMNFGQNLIETLRLPKVNLDYFKRYIRIEGEEFLKDALRKGRGVIALSSHFGSWELFFAAAPLLGYKLSIFTREQSRLSSLNEILNKWRRSKGCQIISLGKEMREIIDRLKKNEIVGLVADHGGKGGIPINFFGRKALTPTGSIRFARIFDTPILPIYIFRIRGPYHKIKILPPLVLENSGDREKDLVINLERINLILEDYIQKYPDQYLWFYKRWKYSPQRDLLILSDGKTGHLRQLESLIKAIEEVAKEKGLEIRKKIIEVRFKNKLMRRLQSFSTGLASRYHCRGCLWCLKKTLDISRDKELEGVFSDIVISCGSSLASLNFVLSSELRAKSIHIMRPGILSTKRFDLVIMPEHDLPPKRRNVLITKGSLNLIDDAYLKEQTEKLITNYKLQIKNYKLKIGLLMGGDTKNFRLSREKIEILIKGLKRLLEELDAHILITTSRRTSKDIEDLIKEKFLNEERCKLLVIANEKNIPFAVGGILGLSDIVIVSPDSISMVSEAVSSGKYVIVFKPRKTFGLLRGKQEGLPKRKRLFLENLEKDSYLRTVRVDEIYSKIKDILRDRPEIKKWDDYSQILEKIRGIL